MSEAQNPHNPHEFRTSKEQELWIRAYMSAPVPCEAVSYADGLIEALRYRDPEAPGTLLHRVKADLRERHAKVEAMLLEDPENEHLHNIFRATLKALEAIHRATLKV